MFSVLVGTTDGVMFVDGESVRSCGLTGHRVSSVLAFSSDNWLAGTYESGMFLTKDSGNSWVPTMNGLNAPCIRTICRVPFDEKAVLCGTEPGRIFRSVDSGHSWTELAGIRKLDRVDEWYLPYSPRAGAVRNIFHPTGDGNRLLASVEVGGLIESQDGGVTWTRHHITVDSDIHYVTGHPTNPSVLFAALGYAGLPGSPASEGDYKRGGVARSTDGGKTWTKLFTDYTRGVIIPKANPSMVIACPGPYVGRQGRMELSRDNGETWQPAGNGIDIPMADMVEEFVEAPDESVWAICAHGRLLRTEVTNGLFWSSAVEGLDDNVKSVSFITN